jgi:hypothetical protein
VIRSTLPPEHFLAVNWANWHCLRIYLPLILLPLRSLLLLVVTGDPFALGDESIIDNFSLSLPHTAPLLHCWLVYSRKQSLISFMGDLLPIKWVRLIVSSIYDLYCSLPKPRLELADFSNNVFGMLFPICSPRSHS